ncbi:MULTISPECIES: DUF2147 domain-containing protein [Acinetobacter]|jgi:uncharacterized protein (DUF2147 family)|uniref:DUF2147 domain-containing protein n=2 Tax=Acinetobacter beijerinckii TaxID=262668 RepID=N9EAX2_9GAMM|nr:MULTISPECIES: DUF2147 domain-containing protein [Acinetobacter]MBC9228765.1 DUF2147 domain-containing protein [Acinetobacter baumannii]ENW06840.1 hypothetical protein F933_01296 [Acinetobacter beijerinckii CIP 110307]ENW07392.1 hypothetical protein F934_00507 [Acinetobacter beijerinckii ANC 3835]MDF2415909.1 DUF2147 domain-containing protein [Acinetobacter beijerinckii]UTO20020.1 DUF2147 domain-containing protein [Acinetobacter sp. Z1]
MMGKQLIGALLLSVASSFTFAEDITGLWQSIDDKTGAPKALIEIRQESNGTYAGKVVKITPRAGYTPKETCVDCPAPYTNKPILGLDVVTGLKHANGLNYTNGRILDPNSGKIYSMKAKLSANGKRMHLRGYLGVSALGRNQIWIRTE